MTSSSCLTSHRNTHFTQSVLRRDQVSISMTIPALDGGISSTNTKTRSLTPPTSLAHTHPSTMKFVSNDPSLWPIIHWQYFLSHWTGLSHQSAMSRSNIDLHFCSCRRRRGGIWLGWDGRCSEPAAILMISPVLTIEQEVGRPYCQSSQLAKNGIIVWTDLGEWRSLIITTGEYDEFATEATLVSHDCAVFGCSYITFCYSVVSCCADSKIFEIRYIGIPWSVYVSRPKIGGAK
jgi:hypothetical protein